MAKSLTSENLHQVFAFPFQDPKWLEKFLIGTLLLLVSFFILPMFLIYGYSTELMRMAIKGKELSLPEWDAWEKKFTDGAKLFVVGLIYTLPFIVFFIVVYGFILFCVVGSEMIDYSGDTTSPYWAILTLLGSLGGMGMFGFGILLVLIIGVLMPAMIGHVVAKDDISAAFRIGEWWKILRANISGFMITYLLVFGLFTALNIVSQLLYMTVILCCIIPILFIPAILYIMTITSVLFGQAYREGVENLEAQSSGP
jgi:hypothetical protein